MQQSADPSGQPQVPPVDDNAFIADTEAQDSGGDDEEEESGKSDKKAGRRKIKIEFIQDKSRRHITFSKRKAGIMKKAYELSTLTGTQVLLLVVSETGLVYTFTTAKLQPLVTQPEGKNLIQACLNAPHGSLPSAMPVGTPLGRSAPQQMQAAPPPGQAPQPTSASPANAQGMPGGIPPMGGPRNVPGGLSISGGPGGPGDEADGDDRGDEVDQESEKRGAPRRRTSQSNKAVPNAPGAGSGAGANNQAGRSPESPSQHPPHLGLPGQPGGGMQNMAGAPPPPPQYASNDQNAPGAPVYGHPMPHLMAPGGGYYPSPPMQWGGAAPSGAYTRR